MFDEIRYELNGAEIDRNRNVGIIIKNYVLTWLWLRWTQDGTLDSTWRKDTLILSVPLNILLGFYEDYKRVIVNARHELILILGTIISLLFYNFLFGNPIT